MAFEIPVLDITFPAGEDLSSDQHRHVVLDSDGTVRRPNAVTDIAVGILQNYPASGEGASVRVLGVSKVVLGATLAAGALIAPEYQSASDAGKAQAPVSTQYCSGLLLQGGEEDDLGSVLLKPMTVTA